MMGLRQVGIGSGQWRIMTPTDHPAGPAGDPLTKGEGLDEATRQRLLAVLLRELADSTREALARGVPQERLDAYLEERMALLRARISTLSGVEAAIGEDRPDDIGNAA